MKDLLRISLYIPFILLRYPYQPRQAHRVPLRVLKAPPRALKAPARARRALLQEL